MFGFLALPGTCRGEADALVFHRVFCGLCDVLAEDYGLPARLLINRDSAFIALLTLAQMSEVSLMKWSRRCNPLSRPQLVFADDLALAYAAAITVCGLQAKLCDNLQDDPHWLGDSWGLLALLSGGKFAKAQAVLADTGFPVAGVLACLAEQPALEHAILNDRLDPWCAAEPSAHALGVIFSHSAIVAGQASASDALYVAGHALGQMIYILDSYSDQMDDRIHGRFNFISVLQARSSDASPPVRQLVGALVADKRRFLSASWSLVEIQQHRPALETVLFAGLPAKVEHLLADPVEPSESGELHQNSDWSIDQMRVDPSEKDASPLPEDTWVCCECCSFMGNCCGGS